MSDLTLPLNGVYFDQIKAGTKAEEYRLVTAFWSKRLVGRQYERVVLTRGYPKASDAERRLVLPWRGYQVKTITHPHFGPEPVEVFAIDVTGRPVADTTDRQPSPRDDDQNIRAKAQALRTLILGEEAEEQSRSSVSLPSVVASDARTETPSPAGKSEP